MGQDGIGLFARLFAKRGPTPGLGPELASGRIEGFTVTVLRTGQIVVERSGDGLFRVVIKYPKQVIGRIDEVLAKAAQARGIRVGVPRGRDPFNL